MSAGQQIFIVAFLYFLFGCRGDNAPPISGPTYDEPADVQCALSRFTNVRRSCIALSTYGQQADARENVSNPAIGLRLAIMAMLNACMWPASNRPLHVVGPPSPLVGELEPVARFIFSEATGMHVSFVQQSPAERQALLLESAAPTATAGFDALIATDIEFGGAAQIPGKLVDLSNIVIHDLLLQWNYLPPALRSAAIYGGAVKALPLSSAPLLLHYLRDVFERDGILVPQTWEQVAALAERYHDPRPGGIKGICVMPLGCGAESFVFRTILASYIQTHGPTHGLLWDPTSLEQLLNSPAGEQALEIFRRLVAAGPAKPPAPDSCQGDHFIRGQCLMAVSSGYMFKMGNLPGNLSVVRGRMGFALLPGSTRVLDRASRQLVPCNRSSCPFATETVLEDDGTVALVNRPISSTNTLVLFNGKSPVQYQYGAYQLFAMLVSGSAMGTSGGLLMGPNELLPKSSEDLSLELVSRWAARGYDSGDVSRFLTAYRATLGSANTCPELKIRLAPNVTKALQDAAAAYVFQTPAQPRTRSQVLTELEAVLNAVVAAEPSRTDFAVQYRRSLNWQEAVPPGHPSGSGDMDAAAADSPPRSGGAASPSGSKSHGTGSSRNGRRVVYEIALPCGSAVAALAAGAAAFIAWRRSGQGGSSWAGVRRRGRRSMGDAVKAPGDSTRLWESLPAHVMDAALQIHHRVVRQTLLMHRGYESATEGDSFILAFKDALNAVAFCVQTQQTLLEATWPDELMEPVYPPSPESPCCSPRWELAVSVSGAEAWPAAEVAMVQKPLSEVLGTNRKQLNTAVRSPIPSIFAVARSRDGRDDIHMASEASSFSSYNVCRNAAAAAAAAADVRFSGSSVPAEPCQPMSGPQRRRHTTHIVSQLQGLFLPHRGDSRASGKLPLAAATAADGAATGIGVYGAAAGPYSQDFGKCMIARQHDVSEHSAHSLPKCTSARCTAALGYGSIGWPGAPTHDSPEPLRSAMPYRVRLRAASPPASALASALASTPSLQSADGVDLSAATDLELVPSSPRTAPRTSPQLMLQPSPLPSQLLPSLPPPRDSCRPWPESHCSNAASLPPEPYNNTAPPTDDGVSIFLLPLAAAYGNPGQPTQSQGWWPSLPPPPPTPNQETAQTASLRQALPPLVLPADAYEGAAAPSSPWRGASASRPPMLQLPDSIWNGYIRSVGTGIGTAARDPFPPHSRTREEAATVAVTAPPPPSAHLNGIGGGGGGGGFLTLCELLQQQWTVVAADPNKAQDPGLGDRQRSSRSRTSPSARAPDAAAAAVAAAAGPAGGSGCNGGGGGGGSRRDGVTRVVFRGLRVRMGLHSGVHSYQDMDRNAASGRVQYRGEVINRHLAGRLVLQLRRRQLLRKAMVLRPLAGVLHAPVMGYATTARLSVVGAAVLMAWDADVTPPQLSALRETHPPLESDGGRLHDCLLPVRPGQRRRGYFSESGTPTVAPLNAAAAAGTIIADAAAEAATAAPTAVLSEDTACSTMRPDGCVKPRGERRTSMPGVIPRQDAGGSGRGGGGYTGSRGVVVGGGSGTGTSERRVSVGGGSGPASRAGLMTVVLEGPPDAAVRWLLAALQRLRELDWPPELLEHPLAEEVVFDWMRAGDGSRRQHHQQRQQQQQAAVVVCRGLRASGAVAWGKLRGCLAAGSLGGQLTYRGRAWTVLHKAAAIAKAGQVATDSTTAAMLPRELAARLVVRQL
ncbi:hypothetical protein VOLCADRAFT_98419 [Volvox carteri f. nagariensis]|uniref:Guanylate cyclase domain-containing protein n=1 Tax=Volvox carteri f. nagariensis TaxID=3068 RepID=D8UFA7_VOLCA|nr:uncharacterized protein VOLCADRAFT_98419 [Volvox carteri f. nagariensis]EFJ41572.1 hypothetical protein VOLCADRAFT_98419 [Volvox carteri f. nagariensis]|eukprot:XP_002957363.1 hypothetical protein VOLCADRAFT_98419 [Volvox carteri f. nagariensis]